MIKAHHATIAPRPGSVSKTCQRLAMENIDSRHETSLRSYDRMKEQ